jgi:hypothetical protein
MRITGRRIRSLKRLRGIPANSEVVPALVELDQHEAKLSAAGLPSPRAVGSTVLPTASGTVSSFNANGGEIVHRDQPKEQVWRDVYCRWIEWHGRYDMQEHWGVRPRAYWQYPRTPIPAPGVELHVAEQASGAPAVVTEQLNVTADSDRLLHTINLLLELFGECELLSETLEPLFKAPVRRLNWDLLPPGQRPWAQLKGALKPITDTLPKEDREVAEYRMKLLNDMKPNFTAIGRAGFRGYIVFGFEKQKKYVLESLYYGNATYVFGKDWAALSQLTKAEILDGNLQDDRIVHTTNWPYRLRRLIQ